MYMTMVPRRRRSDFDLFDSFFGGNDFFSSSNNALMKTDIREHDDKYEFNIDLPGFQKDNIDVELKDGYLTISAAQHKKNDEKENGRFVRQERFYGECSRSFYVGDDITQEDIKAAFSDGILRITLPKKQETEKLPEGTKIAIE